MLLVCCDISETISAVMIRRFGGYMCCYIPTFWRVLLYSDVSDAVLLCFDVSDLLLYSDVSDTILLLSGFVLRYFCVPGS